MKTKIFSLLFATIAGVCNLSAEIIEWRNKTPLPSGYIFLILSNDNKTATVTCNRKPTTPYNYVFQSVDLPSSVWHSPVTYDVTSIESGAFRNSPNLIHVTIPNSVTNLGSGIFHNCGRLSSIIIDTGNMVYDSRDNCNAVIETRSNTLIAGCNTTCIPNSVTNITAGAFAGSGITTISIPNSVTCIKGYEISSDSVRNPFISCKMLTSIIVEAGNSTYDSRDNCNAIIETRSNTLIAGCNTTCIPNSVTSIGARAFYGSGISSLTIPDSVTSIGYEAFYGCSSLSSVTSMATVPPTCKTSAFYNVDCSKIPLYVPEESIDAYKATYWRIFKTILPIGSSQEALDNVEMEMGESKLLRDGQIYIIRGEKIYTITGNEL